MWWWFKGVVLGFNLDFLCDRCYRFDYLGFNFWRFHDVSQSNMQSKALSGTITPLLELFVAIGFQLRNDSVAARTGAGLNRHILEYHWWTTVRSSCFDVCHYQPSVVCLDYHVSLEPMDIAKSAVAAAMG